MAEIPINNVDPNPDDTTTDNDEDQQPVEPFEERVARLKNESFGDYLRHNRIYHTRSLIKGCTLILCSRK